MSNKIGIITNYQSKDLYSKSLEFYKNLEYPKYSVIGTSGIFGMKFLHHVINSNGEFDFDYMIYIDEDCFITDTDEMMSLLQYMIDNNYDSCGMPDGGIIPVRFHNPISPNLFFSIFNIKKIRYLYSTPKVHRSKYEKDLDIYIPHHLIKNDNPDIKVKFDNFEPYYSLYFWMLRNNMKILYLDAALANSFDSEFDDLTTALKSHQNKVFAYHTWYARDFDKNSQNRNRILNAVKKIELLKSR